jgi:hypothetical protein
MASKMDFMLSPTEIFAMRNSLRHFLLAGNGNLVNSAAVPIPALFLMAVRADHDTR